MAGRLEGKVALISGAARGQGRAHAIRLAEEGASIIAVDVCRQLPTVGYPMASPADLETTADAVKDTGREILTFEADVRDLEVMNQIVKSGVQEFGRLDVVCANAGTVTYTENSWVLDEEAWDEVLSVNLTGVWKTVKAAIPAMIDAGNGGSVIITSSAAGLRGWPGLTHYASAKHGLVGLMRTLAIELAPHLIRVNTVHPGNIQTPMADGVRALFANDSSFGSDTPKHLMPVGLLDAIDVANAVLWLASDEARYVTGTAIPIDAGLLQR